MKIKEMLSLGLCFFLFGACAKEEEMLQKIAPYRRTVLIYMGGDNNLASETDAKIAVLSANWNYPDCRIIIYQDKGGSPCLQEVTSRGAITVRVYPGENSASGETLGRVVHEMTALYPAESYGLIVFSHGTGWLPQGMYSNPRSVESVRSIIVDGTHEMDISDFSKALESCHFDFIVFEACLMAGVEVMWELRHRADYIVASTAEILSPGFTATYPQMLETLFLAQADLTSFARIYYDYYNGQSGLERSATISVIRTSALQELVDAASPILRNEQEVTPEEVEYYDRTGGLNFLYSDLGDYFSRKADTPGQYKAVEQALGRVVVYHAATPYILGQRLAVHSGLSIYIPRTSYPKLNGYYEQTEWHKMIMNNGFINN